MSAGSKTSNGVPLADWRPGAGRAALRARAALLADLRAFFAARGVLEVETPLACTSAGTDPALQPLRAHYRGPVFPGGVELYLQTSPEFAMKRLLAAGSGPIYQICKAFRDAESGRLHNPEFTILEWYRPGFDLPRLIAEVAELVRLALGRPDLPLERLGYAELFRSQLGVDPFEAAGDRLRELACDHRIAGADRLELDRDGWLDLLLSHLVQPTLGHGRLTVIDDFPASQAALARLNDDRRSAARFEAYLAGIELANGFHELTDAAEQAARFDADNRRRRAAGDPPIRVDRRLLGALEAGLPDCCGVAVGLDRLLMLRLGGDGLDAVLSFSLARC